MKLPIKQVSLLLLPAFLGACSTPPVIDPVLHGAAQTVTYNQGHPVITDNTPGCVVAATVVNSDADGHVVFWVGATNLTKSPLTFGIEDVSVESEGKPVRVFTYAELARHEKVKLGLGIAAAVLGAAAGAASAAVPATVNTSTNVYANSGRYLGTVHSTATVYNPAQTALAATVFGDQAAINAVALKGGYRANMAALQSVLQLNTVAPGETRGGIVLAKDSGDFEKGYTLQVRFGGSKRDFTFREITH